MTSQREVFISVDVETAGPIPGEYSLLTIGACNADEPTQTFACELKPTTRNADPDALKVTGLSLERLEHDGLEPATGMQTFRDWITHVAGVDGMPVFVGFNAAFDWSFVNYYFHRYLGKNPFGFAALDIKSLYMGAVRSTWSSTRSSQIAAALKPSLKGVTMRSMTPCIRRNCSVRYGQCTSIGSSRLLRSSCNLFDLYDFGIVECAVVREIGVVVEVIQIRRNAAAAHRHAGHRAVPGSGHG